MLQKTRIICYLQNLQKSGLGIISRLYTNSLHHLGWFYKNWNDFTLLYIPVKNHLRAVSWKLKPLCHLHCFSGALEHQLSKPIKMPNTARQCLIMINLQNLKKKSSALVKNVNKFFIHILSQFWFLCWQQLIEKLNEEKHKAQPDHGQFHLLCIQHIPRKQKIKIKCLFFPNNVNNYNLYVMGCTFPILFPVYIKDIHIKK